MNSLQKIFNYQEQQVRTVIKSGEIWFVAKDICDILEFVNQSETIKRLDEDEVNSIEVIDSLGRTQITNIVNEPGLYSLILGSRKTEARNFKRWITHEIIPSIRKTGKYEVVSQNTTDILLNLIHDPAFQTMKATAQAALIRSITKTTKEEKRQELINQPESNLEIQLVDALVELIENKDLAREHCGEAYWPCNILKELITKHTGQNMSYNNIISALDNIAVINSKRRFNLKRNGRKSKMVYYGLKIKTIKLLANKYGIGVKYISDNI